jgi:3-keto-disaccharide hydrolase
MPMPAKSFGFACLCLIATAGLFAFLVADEVRNMASHDRWLQHDIRRPKPPVVEPVVSSAAAPAPKDAVILFDGTNLDAWQTPDGGPAPWKVTGGFMEVAPGTGPIESKGKFGDVQLHVEWATPNPPGGKGQDRGNSGIFLMGLYELQVLDSYRADTYADGQAGAIYGQYPPLANASRPPGEWQTYDIAFRRPRFDKDGKLQEPARLTLTHNGILIQNNEELWGRTNWLESSVYEAHNDRGPIQLQDHGHLVRFRNMWVRELPERPEPRAEDLARPKIISLSAAALDPFTGQYAMGPNKDAPPVTISRGEGHLNLKLPFRPAPLVMQAISPTEFVLPHTDARFTFQRDQEGRVTGVLFKVGDGERLLTKTVR